MRRHAKAATAGSTQRRAAGHGGVTLVVIGALALVALAIVPSGAAAAAPEAFWTRCAANSEGDTSCGIPRGIASSPLDGDIYVGDSHNSRVVQFSPWGVFLRTWGWDVVQSGPDNNGSGFEICVPANGDVCKAGTEGSGTGQFQLESPQGIAVDSEGDVYVLDRGLPSNQRVQKFDSEGHFLRMFGGEVNSGTSGNPNVCTNAGAPTDVCKAGSIGSANGQFGELSFIGNYIAIDTAATATASDDKVYVGDQERIQSFNAAGEYQSQIAQPGVTVKGLAVDPAGNLYASFCGSTGCGFSDSAKANVRKLSPAGTELGTVTVANPQALATDSAGDLYVVDGNENPTIREFTPAGVEVPGFAFKDVPNRSTGIATGSACLSSGHDLYVSNSEVVPNGFIRAYGPAPDEAHVGLCPPPPHAPEIAVQATLLLEATAASVQAQINPKFWADTSYFVQYGTAACIEAQGWDAVCVAQEPASAALLGAGASGTLAKTAKVKLSGLSPATEYIYRFAAESSGGGPVFGKGGTEAQDGQAATFTTAAPLGPPAPDSCPNATFRTGLSAALPDCRAYEMVSPIDKNGGDVSGVGKQGYVRATPQGNRITYSAGPAFGDQPSSRFQNQYLATRGEGGWSTHGINPPLSEQPASAGAIGREVEAFSADLCSEWLYDFNSNPLSPDAQPDFTNLYRRDLCGEGGFEALTVNPPAPGTSFGYVGSSSTQGISADGGKTFFTARAKLTPEAAETNGTQAYVYDRQGGSLRLVSVRRSGVADAPASGTSGAAIGGGLAGFFGGNLQGAISEDGSRAYWMSSIQYNNTRVGLGGTLYLRENPIEPQSAQEHGGATGTGDLSKTSALALATESSAELLFFFGSGEFSPGDPIEGPGIAPGTTIVSVSEPFPGEGEMTLSAPATETTLTEIISASKTVRNLTTETGAFAPGQSIEGEGIAPETTVTAVNPGEGKLTLSNPPSGSATGVELEAFSECTEAEKACTVQVSHSNLTSFWGANQSGSKALYTEGQLENDGSGGQALGTLYSFDAETRTSTLLYEHVRGVVGTSRDLSRIYFVSTDALTGAQQNEYGNQAKAEEPNLYLDEGGQLSFVATLLGGPHGDTVLERLGTTGIAYGIGASNPLYNPARVSADGSHVVFESRAPLTGYDNTDAGNGKADLEVFTYEAGGPLRCVSCNPSGARPSGRQMYSPFVPNFKAPVWAAAWIPTYETPLHGSNVLSEDGGRIFFNANDALVRGDGNGAQDVYEWEAPGVGDCTTQSPAFHKANGGCLYLISSGESPEESTFWEASADGRDVFFITEASLLPQDPGHFDLYDARIDGGFPQPPVPGACEGESCQSAPPPPTDPTLSSASFRGEGNQRSAKPSKRCAKGKRRVQNRGKTRCVPKHHKRKHRAANHNRRTAR